MVKDIISGALFISLGILLPILFHSFGLGSIFLPMFYPIIVAGFILPPVAAIAVGILTPFTSTLLTQMPPMFLLPIMTVEGIILAGIPLLLKNRLSNTLIVIIVLLIDRLVLFVMVLLLAPILNLPANLTAGAAVIEGFPGIILLILLVPVIVNFLNDKVFRQGG